ncbi:hypothetical protein [Gluconobacter sp. P1C6_b]|uniref:hypothetical protein n=1 Tax=Gluconobacter sp. P1C6_b TaxID=2762619 RepID=UPI001C03C325|nr:hypothetical protein [Gluconobacter sp. P1C6_b]
MNMDHSEAASGTDKRKARKKSDTGSVAAQVDLLILAKLLDGVSDGNGASILDALKQNPADIDPLINRIANSRAIEQRKKLTQTIDTMEGGRIDADFAYVGLPAEAQEMDFKSAYDVHLRPRLDKRADGFAVIFDRLDKHSRPLIVETGCLRVPDNWAGDGQSTFQFDWYARERQGSVFTIDINSASIDSARRACSGTTSTILNDSRPALHALGQNCTRPASLLYLDSFDLDLIDPMPSAMHHATEMMAARGLIGEGTIICVDDFDVPPLGAGGKGLIVDQFMASIGARLLYSGYQKIWEL